MLQSARRSQRNKGLVTPQNARVGGRDTPARLENAANHEIDLMTTGAAEELLSFVEMLPRAVYEFPERGRQSMHSRKERDK